jgi:hypothetical protein
MRHTQCLDDHPTPIRAMSEPPRAPDEPEDDDENDGRYGKSLGELLADLQFGHWEAILTEWLARFDGWRAYELSEPSVEPDVLMVSEAIMLLVRFPGQSAGDDVALAQALAQLPFYRWRASGFSYRIDTWHPMMESFAQFRLRGPTHTFVSDRPFQPPQVIAHWLLGCVYRARLTRGRLPPA